MILRRFMGKLVISVNGGSLYIGKVLSNKKIYLINLNQENYFTRQVKIKPDQKEKIFLSK